MRHLPIHAVTFALLAPTLWGCGAGNDPLTRVRDDVMADVSGWTVGKAGDSLSMPYAAGTLVTFTVQHANPLMNHSKWTAETADQAVAKVENVNATRQNLQVSVRLVGSGESLLRVFGDDKSQPQRSVKLISKTVTMLRLYPATRMKTASKEGDVEELGDALLLGTGGETSFMARMFDNDGELFGYKALGVLDSGTDAGPVAVSVGGTAFHVWRDWVQFSSPTIPGHWTRTLTINGLSMRTFSLTVVNDSEIVGAQLFNAAEGKDGERSQVIAEGKSAAGVPIYGGRYNWKLADNSVDGAGDVFHYFVKQKTTKSLSAALGGGTASTEVHAEKGTVGSTAEQSCAQAGPAVWSMAVLGLLLLRSRRVRRAAHA